MSDLYFIPLSQVCRIWFRTPMRSKQVLTSSACRCTRSAALLRRTVWPGISRGPNGTHALSHGYFALFLDWYSIPRDYGLFFPRVWMTSNALWETLWRFLVRRRDAHVLNHLFPALLNKLSALHYSWANLCAAEAFHGCVSVSCDPSKVRLWSGGERHRLQGPPALPPEGEEPGHRWLPTCQAKISVGLAQLSPVREKKPFKMEFSRKKNCTAFKIAG